MSKNQYVQYGCGMSAHRGWRNFDASPTLRFERLPIIGNVYTKNKSRFPENVEYGDIVKGLPITYNSCRAVYCSHVLEHLSLEDFRKALQNTHRILEKGGIFRIVLPDLEHSVKKYLKDPSHEAAITFMKETYLGYEKRNRGLKGFIFSWLGNSQHLWMWDHKSIEHELGEAGFLEIRRANYGDSSEPTFMEVEDKERWDNCLGMECRK
ncbi:MAG: methyltransferase domain-containing protein [Nitrospiraceae bacterium]|nr:MAG: methyltransferase domain-containing protein [Nitrospiraceae bacterium]